MKKAATFTICLAYMLLMLGSSNAAVICFGEDGHVAIELGSEGDCAHFPSSDDASHSLFDTTTAQCHCGPCVDIPLSLEISGTTYLSNKDYSFQPKNWSFVALPEVFPVALNHATVATFAIPPPNYYNQHLLSLRTIVLLI
jgi:hypothetical protein